MGPEALAVVVLERSFMDDGLESVLWLNGLVMGCHKKLCRKNSLNLSECNDDPYFFLRQKKSSVILCG